MHRIHNAPVAEPRLPYAALWIATRAPTSDPHVDTELLCTYIYIYISLSYIIMNLYLRATVKFGLMTVVDLYDGHCYF
jgi:hypothetical protein